jgi:hypothetical protein
MPQITKRQIKDGAIDDSKIQAGANIATSKLAEGSEFVKRDGTVPMTGNLNLGNNKITSLATATNPNDAVNLSLLNQKIDELPSLFKYRSVRAASTANVDIASGPASIDGVTLALEDRVLLKNQTTASENGVRVFKGTGAAMPRAADVDTWTEVTGLLVHVQEGTTNNNTLWLSDADSGGTIDTTSLTFTQLQTGAGGLGQSAFVDRETPAGSVNGTNVTFTLANTPFAGSEHVFVNGILQTSGGTDYSISGTTITMTVAPETGDVIRVSYRKNV